MVRRVVNEEMVEKAVEMALEAAREKAPGSDTTELLQTIRPSHIYGIWLPILYTQTGSYSKVVSVARTILTRMLAGVEQAHVLPRPNPHHDDTMVLPGPRFGL
jgi:hypothetical protein